AYSPIHRAESHFPYGFGERDSDLRSPCRSSDSGSLPPSPFRKCPKQIQARRVAVAEPQTEFPRLCFGAAYQPIAQGESHFLYDRQERDSDLRAPCRSSASGGLPPSPLRTDHKQTQPHAIVVGLVQITRPRCGVDHQPIAQGESHFLRDRHERHSHLPAVFRSSDSGSLPPSPFRRGPKQIQARRVAVAEPQTEFVRGAAFLPIHQGRSHFLYEWQERDSDLRAPCKSSDSRKLPPTPLPTLPTPN